MFALTGRDALHVRRRLAVLVVVGFVILLAVPLASSTRGVVQDTLHRYDVEPVADRAGPTRPAGRSPTPARTKNGTHVTGGGLPASKPEELLSALRATGQTDGHVTVELVPAQRVELDP